MSGPRPFVSRSESVHSQVAKHIRNDIAAGILRDGQQLPSTREMAAEWQVSVFTINQAMDTLAKEGLVVSKPRAGRVVHAPDQAQRNAIRTDTPRVVLIGGYAGSGKTELGRILAHETGWPMLDKDTITRPTAEILLELLGQSPHDRESEVYLTKVRPREYEALSAVMTENLECGNSAIVTAPFLREFPDKVWLTRTQEHCEDLGANLTIVWMDCDVESMHLYLRRRGAARDAGKLSNWPGYVAGIDVDFRPPVDHIVVNNCASEGPLKRRAKSLLATVIPES